MQRAKVNFIESERVENLLSHFEGWLSSPHLQLEDVHLNICHYFGGGSCSSRGASPTRYHNNYASAFNFGRKGGSLCMNRWITSEAAENQVPEHRNVFLPPDRMVFQHEDKDKLSSTYLTLELWSKAHIRQNPQPAPPRLRWFTLNFSSPRHCSGMLKLAQFNKT